MSVLIIDNYDSFTFNLYQFIGELGGDPIVYRNDEITLKKIREMVKRRKVDCIIISPGPGTPTKKKYFGIGLKVIKEIGRKTPLLGVCLGHQGIVYAFGGRISRAEKIMHGKTSEIFHDGKGIFKGVKNPLKGMRYHSLVGERTTIPDCLTVTATTREGEVMAVQHKKYPIYGIQFHPESIATEEGKHILKNFIEAKARR